MFNMFEVIIALLLISCGSVKGANILAIQATEPNSHFVALSAFVEKIAPYHNVTFYFNSNIKGYQPPKNVVVHTFHSPSRLDSVNMSEFFLKPCKISMFHLFQNNIMTTNETYYDLIMTSLNSTPIYQYNNDSFDLLLLNGYGSEYLYQFAHVLDVPIILIVPSFLHPWHHEVMNNPFSWMNDFHFALSEVSNDYFGRFNRFIRYLLISHHYYEIYLPTLNKVTAKFLPQSTPSINKITERIELIFENSENSMGFARPFNPTIVQIGGSHINPTPKMQNLSENLKIFLSDPKGFIYFSLGSMIDESAMTDNIRRNILNVFGRLNVNVLWKWKGLVQDNLPSNVFIQKWLPQHYILNHPNIKLFITQGGMLSMQEAAYYGVATLVIPFVFDQQINGKMAQEKGYGKVLPLCEFSKEIFEEHIRELLNNQNYSINIRRISKIMKYETNDLSKKINWWLNFVLENKDTKLLRPYINYDKWLVNCPVDVFLLFILFISFCSYIFFIIVKYVNIKFKVKTE